MFDKCLVFIWPLNVFYCFLDGFVFFINWARFCLSLINLFYSLLFHGNSHLNYICLLLSVLFTLKTAVTCFLLSTFTIHSSFSAVVCIYNIHLFDEAFFSLTNHDYNNWKSFFPEFPWQPLLVKQISSSNKYTLLIETINEKMKSSTIILLKENCHKDVYWILLLRIQTLPARSNAGKSLFLVFHYYLPHTSVDFICLTGLIFSNSAW